MRSEHSVADLVPVWRRSNQLFENACMLFKILSWFSQKRWAFSRNVVEISEVGRNAFCTIDVHCSARFIVLVMVCLLESRPQPVFLKESLRSDRDGFLTLIHVLDGSERYGCKRIS